MLPSDYDLRVVEQRYLDLRAEAATRRLAKAAQTSTPGHPRLLDRLAALIHVPGFGHAHKRAMTPAA